MAFITQSNAEAEASPSSVDTTPVTDIWLQHPFSLTVEVVTPAVARCSVIVPRAIVDALYEQAALGQKRSVQALGFAGGEVPVSYIKENFKEHLLKHLSEFLLRLSVVNFLCYQIRSRKMIIAGEPRLTNIQIAPDQDAQFDFEVNLIHGLTIYEWKYFPFKAPNRKKYKDLDRQVKLFVARELEARDACEQEVAGPHDWVNFDIRIADAQGAHVIPDLGSNFWFKIGSEDIESPLREVFLGKKVGDAFYTDNRGLQEYFSRNLDSHYNFQVTITGLVSHLYFSLDDFKRHFRIKTKKDLHEKLVEVFSYRNHITQRRAMAQDAITLLLSKHQLEAPPHLVLRQQRVVLEEVRQNPDYNVYRAQPDFELRVKQLAERQVKESIFLDALAYQENLALSPLDARGYINLLNRPRMKEFIHFEHPSAKVFGQEMPIPSEQLKRTCLREKALNHVIYHLMKD